MEAISIDVAGKSLSSARSRPTAHLTTFVKVRTELD